MTLLIDACIRSDSRTRTLTNTLLSHLAGPIETVRLAEEDLPILTEARIESRSTQAAAGDFSDPYFRYAKQFAAADTIVIAAPYWDLSFPAILKQYLENICITELTFHYGDNGMPVGLCNAQKLFYVTTAGGPIFAPEYGYGYVKGLAQTMFGIPDCVFFSAEGLDIVGSDPAAILAEAEETIHRAF